MSTAKTREPPTIEPKCIQIDARGDEIDFQLLVRQQEGYSSQLADSDGFFQSQVFDKSLLLTRGTDPVGGWAYRLLMKDV